jgi:hypothetical protein
MTRQEAQALLALLVAAYPQAQVGEATQAVYVSRLVAISAADGLAAVNALIDESKFFPTIAELLSRARGELPGLGMSRPYFSREAGEVVVRDADRNECCPRCHAAYGHNPQGAYYTRHDPDCGKAPGLIEHEAWRGFDLAGALRRGGS